MKGWHALASAFPERAKLIADYQIDDEPEERHRKIQRLKNAQSGAASNDGFSTLQDDSQDSVGQ